MNADGSSDTSFGDEFGRDCALIGAFRFQKQTSMPVLSDGKILAVHSNTFNIDALRLKHDGKIDETFIFQRYDISRLIIGLTPVANAKFLLAAQSGILRIREGGTVNSGFGNNGFIALSNLRQIVVQPDGKVLTVGRQTRRLTSDGQSDASFSAGRESCAIEVLPHGRIIFVGKERFLQTRERCI